MLTLKAISAYRKIINFGFHLGFYPFHYNNVTLKLTKNSIPHHQWILFVFNGLSQLSYLIYTGITLFTLSQQTSQVSEVFWLILYFISMLWGIGSFTCIWIHRRDIICLFNELVRISEINAKGSHL
jgi:hypothetical protein